MGCRGLGFTFEAGGVGSRSEVGLGLRLFEECSSVGSSIVTHTAQESLYPLGETSSTSVLPSSHFLCEV